MEATTTTTTKAQPRDSADYDALLRCVSETFSNRGGDSKFGLKVSQDVDVLAFTMLPPMWHDHTGNRHAHHGQGVIAVLAGCKDQQNGSSGLFPELLKNEYREAARTIEAFSRITPLVPHPDDAAACGLDLRKGGGMNHKFTVTVDGRDRMVCIDRWD